MIHFLLIINLEFSKLCNYITFEINKLNKMTIQDFKKNVLPQIKKEQKRASKSIISVNNISFESISNHEFVFKMILKK